MKFRAYGLSDIGVSRENNEDEWILRSYPGVELFAVADGMGGHLAGEVAAKEALQCLASKIENTQGRTALEWMVRLRYAIEEANLWVYQMGKKEKNLQGMGTTLCCLLWTQEAILYAHVGDSRIYRMRGRKLELLTQDHSLFSRWLRYKKTSHTPFPYKNVITRAIGTSLFANPEIGLCPYEEGDLYFLCTDGLSDVLELSLIEEILQNTPDLELASQILIQTAKNKGSCDNITLLIVQSESQSEENLLRQQRDDSFGSEMS